MTSRTCARSTPSSKPASPARTISAPDTRIRCAKSSTRFSVSVAALCRGNSLRGGPATQPCSTRHRTRRAPNCTGRRAMPTSRPSCARRGTGIRPTRTGTGTSRVPRQRTTLRRLFNYSRPYRGRLAWAVVGMVVYAIGSAGLGWLIKPIFDQVLPKQQEVSLIAWGIVGVYLLKGIGSYVSSYLMADVGQRVVMDLRNDLYRHI